MTPEQRAQFNVFVAKYKELEAQKIAEEWSKERWTAELKKIEHLMPEIYPEEDDSDEDFFLN